MTADEPIMVRAEWREQTAADRADARALDAMIQGELRSALGRMWWRPDLPDARRCPELDEQPRVRYAPGAAPDTSPPPTISSFVGAPSGPLSPDGQEINARIRDAMTAADADLAEQLAARIRAAFPSDVDGLTPLQMIERARDLYGLTVEVEDVKPLRFLSEPHDWRTETYRMVVEQEVRFRFRLPAPDSMIRLTITGV